MLRNSNFYSTIELWIGQMEFIIISVNPETLLEDASAICDLLPHFVISYSSSRISVFKVLDINI
jgi:hypothetical protein